MTSILFDFLIGLLVLSAGLLTLGLFIGLMFISFKIMEYSPFLIVIPLCVVIITFLGNDIRRGFQ